MTSDKAIALANGTDPVSPERITLTAEVKNYAGTVLSGKTISFVITAGTGSLVNAAATTNASGLATVQVQRNPITAPNTTPRTVRRRLRPSASSICQTQR
jgi:hypothetical protein